MSLWLVTLSVHEARFSHKTKMTGTATATMQEESMVIEQPVLQQWQQQQLGPVMKHGRGLLVNGVKTLNEARMVEKMKL